jgi:hypothetical protein
MLNRELIAEKGNVKIFAIQDEDAENPWKNWDLPFEWNLQAARYFSMRSENYPEDLEFVDGDQNHPDYWYEPVYAYIHSSVTVSITPFGCRWDSGVLGYCAVKRPSRGGEFKRRAAFRKALASYVKILDDYLQGECYGYSVEVDGEEIDSCWGFIGSDHAESGLLDAIQGYLV